ncbi:MFS family permease [Acinetobacter baylyi]|uniref:MFS family permease n=1 Tax=Acinetobacter baylyi TaxID=202950 RepID=A0ABU0UXR8_ACIBI|nr:MFS transporter [Acinetobacter baylyi]MDQ1209339.1 MFS family permease [Acinetobacter baylyi]MDR6107068.1 MFS family permease [Acinetobacter baylyi]MDR6186211.1 MFS family permease [Acinetobacter baylyi]
MSNIDRKTSVLAIMVAHCAGMVDMIALPIWMGVLIGQYHFNSQQAGMVVTLFLAGVTLASLGSSSLFNRFAAKPFIVAGFFASALAFVCTYFNTALPSLSVLHFIGGLATGIALSFTHGTIGLSKNPQRLFGMAGCAIGIFGIIFTTAILAVLARYQGAYFFIALALIMVLAGLVTVVFLPDIASNKQIAFKESDSLVAVQKTKKFSKAVWFCMLGVTVLALNQAMNVSFYERIGVDRQFDQHMISLALIIYAITCIFPAPLAAYLQNKINPLYVLCIGPLFQAAFSLMLTQTHHLTLYIMAGSGIAFCIIFIHTFAFGLLAKMDPTGRAVAATPAMLMTGSAIGPILGGTLIQISGFQAIGFLTLCLALLQIILFHLVRLSLKPKQNIPVNLTAS